MKKIIYYLMAIMLVASVFSFAQKSSAKQFNDTEGHWASHEISYLSDEGIVKGVGDGQFGVSNNIKRADAAIMLSRSLNLDTSNVEDPGFNDISKSDYYYNDVAASVKAGFIGGYGNGKFMPNKSLTRAEMAKILVVAFHLSGSSSTTFKDINGNWAQANIKTLVANNITAGYSDHTFRPNKPISRAEFATLLARVLNPDFKLSPEKKDLKVAFIDVGQGDSIFVQFPNGKNMLVDGGRSSAGDKVVSYLNSLGVKSIDLLVGTHPDADHIGGLPDVINHFEVKKVLDSGKDHTTQTYTDYLALIDQKNIPFEVATSGEYLSVGGDVKVHVLNSGDSAPTDETNDSSIVLKVSYGNEDVLLTGDAPIDVEEEMMQKYDVSAEILKVGHHGSDTSTSQAFVNAVHPDASILSYGENNYGHPNAGVVDRLKTAGSKVYSTYESGDIVATISPTAYQISATPWTGTGNDGGGTGDTGSTTGNLDITTLSLDGEYIIIKNNGSTSIDLTGWSIVSTDGNQTFNFPDGYTLGSGQSVKVVSGNDATANPPSQLLWSTAYIWNNNGDNAELYSANGTLVDSE